MSVLQFQIDDWDILKKIFANINEIIDEVIIECTFDGLNFKGIDRAHVCFFESEISSELFDEYSIEKPLLLYIDLYELVKVLKRGNKKDKLILKADDEIIKVIFKNKNNRSFSITQIDLTDDIRNLPVLEYSTTFEYDFDSLKNTLKDADLYSDRLTFIREDDLLIFKCDGTNGNYQNECRFEDKINNSYSATYSLDWLFKIFNNKLSSNNFKISMGDDYPMLIEFNLDYIKLNYLLAPRLENGDD